MISPSPHWFLLLRNTLGARLYTQWVFTVWSVSAFLCYVYVFNICHKFYHFVWNFFIFKYTPPPKRWKWLKPLGL